MVIILVIEFYNIDHRKGSHMIYYVFYIFKKCKITLNICDKYQLVPDHLIRLLVVGSESMAGSLGQLRLHNHVLIILNHH